jgi:hypothetical protein
MSWPRHGGDGAGGIVAEGLSVHAAPIPVMPLQAERHCILVQQPGCQDIGDFDAIAAEMRRIAPDIEPMVAVNDRVLPVLRKRAATRPTLVVSPGALHRFAPLRGRVYAGRPMPKIDEMRMLLAGGIPVPDFEEIVPGVALPEARFGSHVVLKPVHELASFGRGLTLCRREAVRYRVPRDYPPDHPGSWAPMVAQRFIDTGPRVSHYRVLTLFGEPLYAYRAVADEDRPPLDVSDAELAETPVKGVIGRRTLTVTREHDVLALARRTYRAAPEIPLQGCDIVREAATGALYVMEINPGANTWIFSNVHAQAARDELRVDDLTQAFDAFATAARVLVERTRAEAV